jgi:cellulose synthase/poly-beta-1,6-N-acetylglucosamine synthase-like glycosyltransferase
MSKHPEIGACGGLGLPIFDGSPPFWFEQYKHCYAVGPQNEIAGYVESSVGYLWGAGLTVRKSAWDDIITYGFPFSLVGRSGSTLSAGEDVEICFALRCCGWRLWYDDRLTYYHVIPAFRLTLQYLKKMHRGFGEAGAVLTMYDTILDSDFHIDHDYRGAWIMDSWQVIKSYLRQQIAYLLKFDQLVWIKLLTNSNFAIGKLRKIVASPTNYDQLKYQICLFGFNAKSNKLRTPE